MYIYKAFVTYVVDGDTFDAIVDLGFSIKVKQRFRLKDVDTPETWRPKTESEREHGQRAKDFVIEKLLNKEVTLTSVKISAYNRYEAFATLLDGSDLGQLLIENDLVKLDKYEDINDSI